MVAVTREDLITGLNRVGLIGSVRAGLWDGALSPGGEPSEKLSFGIFFYDNQNEVQVIPGEEWTTIMNDGAGVNTTTEFGPAGVLSVLDTSTGRINLEQLSPGDEVYIRHTVNVIPNFAGVSYSFSHKFGSPEFGTRLAGPPMEQLSNGGIATNDFTFDTHFYIDNQDSISGGCFPQIFATNSVTINLRATYVSITKRG